jgi:aspartate-semialdehyde dehydrogenase
MLMGMAGLFRNDLVEWMTTMTYQAASGAGAAHLRELAEQIACVGDAAKPALQNGGATALDVERRVSDALRNGALPKEQFGYPLAASLLPWIDQDLGNGQSREEWKGQAETNKILGRGERPVPIDGVCVRVGAMRCHSQALTIKLRKKIPVAEVAGMIAEGNEWVRVVPNRRAETLAELTPAAVTGKLSVLVGRIRALPMGPDYVTAFTVGDQLLWGAAEPLRRMLRLLLDAGVRD